MVRPIQKALPLAEDILKFILYIQYTSNNTQHTYKGLFTYYVSQNWGFVDPPLPADIICEQPLTKLSKQGEQYNTFKG